MRCCSPRLSQQICRLQAIPPQGQHRRTAYLDLVVTDLDLSAHSDDANQQQGKDSGLHFEVFAAVQGLCRSGRMLGSGMSEPGEDGAYVLVVLKCYVLIVR